MTRTRYRIFENERPYYLTNTIVAWLPVFSHRELVDIVLESWRFLQNERNVSIFAYVVLENHLHWIASASDLSQQIRRFKSFTARRIIDRLQERCFETTLAELRYFKQPNKTNQSYQLWQEGSHPQQIQDDAMMWQKIEYIHNNPVRRGYVDDPLHWRYSSARNYANQQGLIDVATDWR